MIKDNEWLQKPKNIHWKAVRLWGKRHSDGCTGVTDIFVECCYYHDWLYQNGKDFAGEPITRREADRRFRLCIQSRSRLGRFSPISWIRWIGVRTFGGLTNTTLD